MKNKIIINTFKGTGKWYEEIHDTTDFKIFEWEEVKHEMELKHPKLKDFNYTLHLRNKDATVINERLIINL